MRRPPKLGLMLGAAAVVLVALTACNPIVNQPTAVRDGGVSRSGTIIYSGDRGWLEVQVRSAPSPDVSVRIQLAEDNTRSQGDPFDENWCHFSTTFTPALSGGETLGFRRLESVGPGTYLTLEFDQPIEGTQFDVRVVDDDGNLIGDLTHYAPTPKFDSVWGSICIGPRP